MHQRIGNLSPLPGIFPDQMAPVVRTGAEGRELAMLRWGFPSPPGIPGRREWIFVARRAANAASSWSSPCPAVATRTPIVPVTRNPSPRAAAAPARSSISSSPAPSACASAIAARSPGSSRRNEAGSGGSSCTANHGEGLAAHARTASGAPG